MRTFDVIKSHREMTREETCACGAISERKFVPSRVHFVGTSVQHPEYNPGLGCVVNNKQHRAEIARQKGLEEVGNTSVESIHKHFDKAKEEKLDKAYDEAIKGWVGNGDIGA